MWMCSSLGSQPLACLFPPILLHSPHLCVALPLCRHWNKWPGDTLRFGTGLDPSRLGNHSLKDLIWQRWAMERSTTVETKVMGNGIRVHWITLKYRLRSDSYISKYGHEVLITSLAFLHVWLFVQNGHNDRIVSFVPSRPLETSIIRGKRLCHNVTRTHIWKTIAVLPSMLRTEQVRIDNGIHTDRHSLAHYNNNPTKILHVCKKWSLKLHDFL